MYGCLICTYVCILHVCLVPMGPEKRFPGVRVRAQGATMWLLGIKPGPFGRVANAFNC